MASLKSLGACFATTAGLTVAVSVACSRALHHPAPHVAQGVTVALLASGIALVGGVTALGLERAPHVLGFSGQRRR